MREKDENRRQHILDVTTKMIISEGISGVTLTKVAKAAGISQSNIYIYFKDKADIVKQTFLSRKQLIGDYLMTHYSPKGSAIENLTLFARALYQFAIEDPDDMALIQQFNASPVLATLDLSKEDAELNFNQIFKELKQGVEDGELREMDPDVILTMGFVTITTYAQRVAAKTIDPVTTPLSAVIDMIIAASRKPA
ncbi:transcription regulator [Furfurilactobacillus rossiae]|uniref:TetR/AcrR family transcriptional regulator n=1 Tax=Furfurilactobacillus rossiae TaxID=231049 RepID=UPI0015BBE080|nr:TetR/AcrR family transcriptional regulator [Furfurilactobacillus rossiae]MCF6164633.1 TetR/AcrR family transcriptional regulator [Furfurilactobacillus rossiae]QLE64921.1 transcription regulator [Furfurilactobacillus rossiae]